MVSRFRGKNRRIVAGVDFGPGTDDFVRDLVTLTHRTDMTLRLVHVVDPQAALSRGARLPGEYVHGAVARRSEDVQQQQAEERFASLKETVGDVALETQVARGPVAEALKADALFHQASLIATSSRPVSHKLIPRGFSTAMSLMADSPLPVLVIPAGGGVDFTKVDLKLMVADDLSDRSRGALRVAVDLATDLKPAKLIHLHVHDRTEQQLRDWAAMAEQAFLHVDKPPKDVFTPETIVHKTSHDLVELLKGRLGPTALGAMSPEIYEPVIGFGDVLDEFERIILERDPDILVTGRHQFFHTDPLGIGRVPFYALLGLSRPVIVGPEQHYLT